MNNWRDRGRTGGSVNLDGTGAVANEGDVALPLGSGEWEDALGLPLCVVCQNVSYTHRKMLGYSTKTGAPVRKDRLLGKDPGVERREVRSRASVSKDDPIEAYVSLAQPRTHVPY